MAEGAEALAAVTLKASTRTRAGALGPSPAWTNPVELTGKSPERLALSEERRTRKPSSLSALSVQDQETLSVEKATAATADGALGARGGIQRVSKAPGAEKIPSVFWALTWNS